MDTTIKFQPIRGTEASILELDYLDGAVYFTSDTGKIYMDKDNQRILMGNSGVSLFYAEDDEVEQDPDIDELFIIALETIENYKDCSVGDLILNQSDGCFYKIDEIDTTNSAVVCYRLAVSGSGSGGGSTTHRGKVTIVNSGETDILNGDPASVTIMVSSMTEDGEPVQQNIPAEISLAAYDATSETYKVYYKDNLMMTHNESITYDLTSLLRESARNRITITAEPAEENKFTLYTNSTDITTHFLEISWNEVNFSNLNYFENGQISTYCNITQDVKRTFDLYFDDQLVYVGKFDTTTVNNPSYVQQVLTPQTTIKNPDGSSTGNTIESLFTHGPHTISAQLSLQTAKGERGNGTAKIYKEVAIRMEQDMPLIWIGEIQDSYYEYDTILIPFRVYDPDADSNGIRVALSKNGDHNTEIVRYIPAELSGWSYWEIVDLTVNDTSYYTIRIGQDEKETRRDLSFTILADPRNMQVVSSPIVSFDSRGRSNTEEKTRRQTLMINGNKATFTNFNWYNNGWLFDENQTTCLRISNGASVSIPIGPMTFQGSGDTTSKHTIEIQFKVRNVQDYAKLITNYTRYTDKNGWNDSDAFAAFLEQRTSGYSNYDAFLANYYLDNTPNTPEYDDLEYSSTYKTFNFENVVCSYASKAIGGNLSEANPGICIGPQDTFFTNGTNTVTADFVENELINLAFVFTGGSLKSGGDLLMEIYMNGVLTSVARSSLTTAWSINSQTIDFNSSACDIDLYKIRTYNQALIAPNIIQNYAFDLKDTDMWDQKDLGYTNNALGEYQFSYNAMLSYNANHPNNPLMPYIILYTTQEGSQNRLPYNKANDAVKGTFEFVNTALDAAYKNGRLAIKATEKGYESVEDYYIHHCPSFITTENKADFSVQGTSSQFYPRRNIKAKTKGDMYLNRGPFAEAYAEDPTSTQNDTFYMDNDTVGTDKFTLKIDYMESSGDYNRGFANLVANAYSKHPIEDYGNRAFDNFDKYGKVSDYRTSVQGYPVLAFHWPDNMDEPIFIGRYNMLLDKGSDACYGFKPDKSVTQKFLDGGKAKVRDYTECWEFENNSRGFCSFRDPWLRKDLSFTAPEGVEGALTAAGAPIVADSFEYRYNVNDDIIDLVVEGKRDEVAQATFLSDFKNIFPGKITVEKNQEGEVTAIRNSKGELIDFVNDSGSVQQFLLDLYSNWEKAVAWVWSTATDTKVKFEGDDTEYDIPSIGTYTVASDLAEALFVTNKYYIQDGTNYVLASTYNSGTMYYVYNSTTQDYNVIRVTDDATKVYKKNTYYILQNNNYILSADDFESSVTYYTLIENEGAIDSKWDLESPVTYGSKTYTKDTKEYRQAKFKNELSSHFDIEYLAAYFIMTEIFECYDSRGKNCMMASWGPQREGGEYIWYPIFYDIDTQLGINNTGIPSFEYYIDATEDGTFSTNDSVLWNNFYAYFKTTIVEKYEQLMGRSSAQFNGALKTPLLKRDIYNSKVSTVDSWYMSDPDITDSYAMRGDRPLLAINMDEYFKYITPTNTRAKDTLYGRLTDGGTYSVEADTYFYALQGDRHLYRKQFLTNRINYIDSWLTLDNYARGGENRIRSRISANNPTSTSDKWISGTAINGAVGIITGEPYWKNSLEYGEKVHEFDGEYWITMTPIRNSYVTVGTDAENFPSLKYTGSPVRFTTPDLKNGIINSGNYKEQLYYIYGLDQMKSLGDLSKLYFQEFELTGSADKMTDLLLGYDGLDENGDSYRNNGVNRWTVPAGITQSGMPLLKEVNLCNIQFKESNVNFDFSSCEKLENFRNTGSNIVQVTFADGVALNTLYLTNTTTVLTLVEARLLTKLITTYVPPTKDPLTDKLVVANENKGLYITDLTDKSLNECTTNITTLNIQGGNLGYYSYDLLLKYYRACGNSGAMLERKVNLTNVQWSPYTLIEDDSVEYDDQKNYFLDNGHFGLESYVPESDEQWIAYIQNKLLYVEEESVNGMQNNGTNIENMSLFNNLIINDLFRSTAETNNSIPNLTGITYVYNDEAFDEADIQERFQTNYPNMTFFFNNITKGYAARFVVEENGVQTLIGRQKIARTDFGTKIFTDPTTLYSISSIKELMPNYDFKGWALDPEGNQMVITMTDENDTVVETNNWNNMIELTENVIDYTYYAIFEIKKYEIKFEDPEHNVWSEFITYGEIIPAPSISDFIPVKDDSSLPIDKTYAHSGWSLVGFDGLPVNVSSYRATSSRKFYALFEEQNVYDNVNYDLFRFEEYQYTSSIDPGYDVSGLICFPAAGATLTGKVTIPKSYQGTDIVALSGFHHQQITHIFLPEDNEIRALVTDGNTGCFQQTYTLKYFDFKNGIKLRNIGSRSFNECGLMAIDNVIDICSNTFNIGTSAFVQAFGDQTSSVTVKLTNTVVRLDQDAIAFNDGLKPNSTMIIGESNKPSHLDFSSVSNITTGSSEGYRRIANNYFNGIFNQTQYSGVPRFSTIIFYTNIYDANNPDAKVYKDIYTIKDCIGFRSGEVSIINPNN